MAESSRRTPRSLSPMAYVSVVHRFLRGNLAESRQLPVVQAGERENGRDGANEGHEHVPLRIPGVALCGQVVIGVLTQHHGRPELPEFE